MIEVDPTLEQTLSPDNVVADFGEDVEAKIADLQALNEFFRDALPFIWQMYDRVDLANAWEVAHTRANVSDGSIRLDRLPYYGNRTVLADRAFGHAIGVMVIVQLFTGATKKQVYKIERALQHYLIARQLNDDLHDWRKDLHAGHLSTVVVDLLRGAGIETGSHDLAKLTGQLEAYFFRHGLKRVCTQLLGHVNKSRAALKNSQLIADSGGFITLLNDLEASAIQAIEIQANEHAFLVSYQQAQAELSA